jgi:capsular polysaccharide biosynthesis protein
MPSTHELRIIDAQRASPGPTGSYPKPAQAVRIWAGLLAALMVGFALVLGFTWNELDDAVKRAGSSLATIATIGN